MKFAKCSCVAVTAMASSFAYQTPSTPQTAKQSLENKSAPSSQLKLPSFTVHAPNATDHALGTELILLTLRATAFFKGEWMMAHGLVGVSLLDGELHEHIAYASLYKTLAVRDAHKLYACSLLDDALLTEPLYDKTTHLLGVVPNGSIKGVIGRREAILAALADDIEARFVYDAAGAYALALEPDAGRASDVPLRDTFEAGAKFYAEMAKQGYHDKTLGDALGIAGAILNYDGLFPKRWYEMPSRPQVYSDALAATLAAFKHEPQHTPFLLLLGREMDIRGLAAADEMLLPTDQKEYEGLLKMVAEDLKGMPFRKPATVKK